MGYIQSTILGIVEGATEYLPISSTFHLIWAAKLLGISQSEFQKAYEVIIQTGAILAVIILYWKIIRDRQLVLKILASFLPTAAVGLILYKIIKNVFFENALLQIAVFLTVGVIFVLYEKYRKNKTLGKTIPDISYKDCLTIGLAQSVAVIPGVSRAGAVILTMMFLGIRRDEAAKFSFILAVPTLLAASGLDLVKSSPIIFAQADKIGYLVVGFIAAFISALFVVGWFIKFLQGHTLSGFGWYRIALGVVLIFSLFV